MTGSGEHYVLSRFKAGGRRVIRVDDRAGEYVRRIHAEWGEYVPVFSSDQLEALEQYANNEIADRLRHITDLAERMTGLDFSVRFSYLPSADMIASSGRTQNGDWVICLDEFVERFLFGLCVNRSLRVYGQLAKAEATQLLAACIEQLDTYYDPEKHFDRCDNMEWAIARDRDISTIGLMFSRGMLSFILAHEMSHVLLGHTPADRGHESEMAADSMAMELFLRLAEESEQDKPTAMLPLYDCAPLAYFDVRELLDLYASTKLGKIRTYDGTHPAPSVRREHLQGLAENRLSSDGLDLYDAFHGSLKEVARTLS